MSFTSTYAPTTFLHPLEMNDGTFIERKNSCKRLSISSDLSDEDEETYQQQRRFLSHNSNSNNWSQLLSQFDSQPDMMKLIQLCKEEENRRCQEETRMKLKEYQVMRQLQDIQDKQYQFMSTTTSKEFQLQLPPLSHRK